jgi:hypothetical protein
MARECNAGRPVTENANGSADPEKFFVAWFFFFIPPPAAPRPTVCPLPSPVLPHRGDCHWTATGLVWTVDCLAWTVRAIKVT